jgi:hypothetical protein
VASSVASLCMTLLSLDWEIFVPLDGSIVSCAMVTDKIGIGAETCRQLKIFRQDFRIKASTTMP